MDRLPIGVLRRALGGELLAYGACSAAALALDYGLLLLLTSVLGLHYLVASAIGFLSGLVLIYGLSRAFVFRAAARSSPMLGFGLFLITGLLGLFLTQLLMQLWVGRLGFTVIEAKALTAGIVFIFNFLSRRALLNLAQSAPSDA